MDKDEIRQQNVKIVENIIDLLYNLGVDTTIFEVKQDDKFVYTQKGVELYEGIYDILCSNIINNKNI